MGVIKLRCYLPVGRYYWVIGLKALLSVQICVICGQTT